MKLSAVFASPLLIAGLTGAQAETIDNTSYARNAERHLAQSCDTAGFNRLESDKVCMSAMLDTAFTMVRDLRGYIAGSRNRSETVSDALDDLDRSCLAPASRFGGHTMDMNDYVEQAGGLINRCSDSFDRAQKAVDLSYQPRAQSSLRLRLNAFSLR